MFNSMDKTLAKAIADFQQEVPTIHEQTKGYGYTYASLNQIFKVINPLLKKHKLGFTQLVNGTSLCTTIFHTETGATIEAVMDIPQGVQMKGMNDFQVLGSAITYCRRYHISAILGLVSDADIDASGEQTKGSKPKLSAERFKAALAAIESGEYTTEELTENYALTNAQLKNLK